MRNQQKNHQKNHQRNNKNNKNFSAFDTAAYFLSFKDRTVKEIVDKLTDKGYPEEEIDVAVSKLLDYGYLDDERYASAYFKDNCRRKGVNLIKRELLLRGVDKDVVSLAIESLEDEAYKEQDAVRDIYNRRFANANLSDEREKRRIYAYFQRRGFSFDIINQVVRSFGE
jgi:regulatory protein